MSKGSIVIVEDDPLQRRLFKQNLEQEGYTAFETETSRAAAQLVEAQAFDVAIVDFKLKNETGIDVIEKILQADPLITPIIVTAFANVENAVEAMKKGAYDYITKPIDFEKFLPVIARAVERRKLRREVAALRSSLEDRFSARSFVFAARRMEEVARLMARASQTDATVLISGETGTGKDQIAKTIHFSSMRKSGPYLAVNIPSLPETLIESELFGAEKGSFTGAHERKIGMFEAASGGTIILDEIGDLPQQVQVKLLRVIQDREFFRLGSAKPLKTDVRIIATTNRDLAKAMEEQSFRPDLYYRLNVISIEVPPLRVRKEDVLPLVDHFIARYSAREGKKVTGISQEAMAVLLRYSFPGNVRELENVIERAVIFCDGDTVTRADLPVFLGQVKEEDLVAEDLPLPEKVRRLEKREIRRALLETHGVKSKAARALGITERMLSYKMKIYGIRLPDADSSGR